MKDYFGPDGLLSEKMEFFEHRSGQLAMALAVEENLEMGGTLIVEAGTGIGKTLSYLIPAILCGRKVVVSTGTKNLQEQLYRKDIPFLKKVLHHPFKACTMKGRSNYLCLHRLSNFFSNPIFPSSHEARIFKRIVAWAPKSVTGDRAELGDLPDNFALWNEICSRRESCVGQRCRYYDECFITRMRKSALDSQLIVVNHHLFFADLALRGSSHTGVIPTYDAVIFDEAHQIEEIAGHYFGVQVSNFRVRELVRDTAAELQKANLADAHLQQLLEEIILQNSQCFFDIVRSFNQLRGRLRPFHKTAAFTGAYTNLFQSLKLLENTLGGKITLSEELLTCAQRAGEIVDELNFILSMENDEIIYWYEIRGKGVFLSATPVDISHELTNHLYNRDISFVFTSATLTTDNSFSFIRSRLGLTEPVELMIPSPFDYTRQALIYLPANIPEPQASNFVPTATGIIEEVLQLTGGRAFVLFTSKNKLEEIYNQLNIPFSLLKQGEKTRERLLEEFSRNIPSVLLATSSFWEGVDVRGEALSCVIIDKLPFAVPSDPLVEARIEYLRKQGKNPFREYQIPAAIISLKQGFGRLIRSANDRGVMCLLDSRILNRFYGKMFLDSLPPCRITHDIKDISSIFELPNTDEISPG